MSQFPTASNTYDAYDQNAMPRKTSGVAITALVFSLIGIIPCCGLISAPLGFILGLVGAVKTGPRSPVKGRGLSVTAMILALVFIACQIGLLMWGMDAIMTPVKNGPVEAMRAGFAGDIAGFKSEFHGGGASASDEEARAFIETLRGRYGEFQSMRFDQNANAQPQFGQPEVEFQYRMTFANGESDANALRIFADQQGGGFVNKWGYIEIVDTAQGNLRYPARPLTLPTGTPAEASPPSTPSDAPPDSPPASPSDS